MRNRSVLTLVVILLLASSGDLRAQTADLQEQVEVRLALQRLGRGIRIGESLATLAMVPSRRL